MSNSAEDKRPHLKIALLIEDNAVGMATSLNLSQTQIRVNPKKKEQLSVSDQSGTDQLASEYGLKQQQNKNIQKKPKLLFICTNEGQFHSV